MPRQKTRPLFPTEVGQSLRPRYEREEISRRRIREASHVRVHQRREYLHNFIILCVSCGARQGEVMSLRHKGVEAVDNFVRLTVGRKTRLYEITEMPSCRWAYGDILKHKIMASFRA